MPWITKLPLVRSFRIPKGPEVRLVTPIEGVSFQVLRKSRGRLMPVSQLSEVEKVPARVWSTATESVGSGVLSFGILVEMPGDLLVEPVDDIDRSSAR